MNHIEQLEKLRKRVHETDIKLLELLAKRFRATGRIQNIKKELKIPVNQKDRESGLLKGYLWLAQKHGLPQELIKQLFGLVFAYSKKSGIIKGNKK